MTSKYKAPHAANGQEKQKAEAEQAEILAELKHRADALEANANEMLAEAEETLEEVDRLREAIEVIRENTP